MTTFSLSGSGTHALSSNTTGLQVSITTPSSVQGVGTANPPNHFHTGMLRFSDGTAYWDPVPITGGPQFIPVPQNATSIGYAMQGGALVSVVEIIGGTVFFSGGSQSVETLSDVQITSIADGQTLTWNAAAGKWENVTPTGGGGGTGLYSAYLNYQDQKTSGTSGGSATAGSWFDRVLNTEVADTGNHGTLASNHVTLDAGTYRVLASVPGFLVDGHRARLQDLTNSVTLVLGSSEWASSGAGQVQSRSMIAGRFTLSGATVIAVQQRIWTTQSNVNAQGQQLGWGTEVYSILELWKEA